jgi:hypothetical protein
MVRAARVEIDSSSAAARKQIEDQTGELSDRILRAIIPPSAPPMEAAK